MFFLTLCALGIGGYLAGVRRMHARGHRWPVARTASWLGGLLLLAAVTNLGVARYAYVLFSAHMAQHMVLSMLVPILLVGGAPVTLALRALRRPADPRVRGAREWLLIVVHSRLHAGCSPTRWSRWASTSPACSACTSATCSAC